MKSSKKLQKKLVISFFITIFALEIKVINIKTIGYMFNYKVSYNKSWNGVGTCYNQMITITIPSKNTLFDINKTISDFRDNSNDFFTHKYFKPLCVGKNYTSLRFRDYLIRTFLGSNNRILDRNTIINIKIK